MKNLLKHLNTLKLDKNEHERLLNLFKMMIKCRDQRVAQSCYSQLYEINQLQKYLDTCIKPILKCICKYYFLGFNGGYQSSSISEASNSRLKRMLPTKQITLVELREILITAEELTLLSKRFIKARKLHKMKSPL